MSDIILKNWYQLDFTIKNPVEDLKRINSLMENLIQEKLITKWFFLYEKPDGILTVRVRIHSDNKLGLEDKLKILAKEDNLTIYDKQPFREYFEDSNYFPSEEVVERFANIMSEASQLTVKKLKKQIQFDNYRIIERISHCLFNNIAGFSLKTEENFLSQRFRERTRQSFDGNFENRIVEKKKE